MLGPIAVVDDHDATIDLAAPNLRRLLAALTVHAGSVVSSDALAQAVWGDAQPDNPAAALQSLVSRLRRRLPADDGAPRLVTHAPGYVLEVASTDHDAGRFAGLVARARDERDPSVRARVLDDALDLWRGPAYAEFADQPFARAEARRLDELRTAATRARARAAMSLGDTADAVARLARVAADAPLDEEAHRGLVLALHRDGRRADALAAYRAFRDRLAEELGLEPSARLQEVERHVLRGGDSGERDRVRVADDRAGTAPSSDPAAAPPRDDHGRGTALPPPPALIGRDALLAEARQRLRPGRVLTLLGPGGVGKTSLATHLAAAAAAEEPTTGDFPDGVWWCDLASVAADAAVVAPVLTTLSVRQTPGTTELDTLGEALRHQRLLLVLDNAEHVLEGVSAVAGTLTKRCPGVAVLVTSRERLAVADEVVVDVDPLAVDPTAEDAATDETAADAVSGATVGASVPPAVELFLRRAQAVDASFSLTADNRDAVTEVCRRLDGLPLALELAATRMRSMTPADLADRLSWRFRVLRSGPRSGSARHRTLHAVVDWSYQLLTTDQQRVFETLSVFVGEVDLATAEAVTAVAVPDLDMHDVAAVVASLVDSSMLVARTDTGAARYAMLETLRAYGRARLAERGGTGSARRAHALHQVTLAEEMTTRLVGPTPRAALATIDAALDELRAAHAWAVKEDLRVALRLVTALPAYAELRTKGECYRWAEQTVALAEDHVAADPSTAATVCAVAALSARFRGDMATAARLAERGVAHAPSPTDPSAYMPLHALAEIALYEGRLDDCLELCRRSQDIPATPATAVFQALGRTLVVLALSYAGRDEEAVDEAERQLAEVSETSAIASSWTRYGLAETLVDVDPDRALVVAEEALAAARASGDRFLAGVALVTVASLHSRVGDPATAVRLFDETVSRWWRARNWTQQWVAARSIVGLLLRLDAVDDAAVLLGAVRSSSTAPEAFGTDAQRLDDAADEIRARLGPDAAAAARRRGEAMSDEATIEWLRRTLARLQSGVSA